ncbi:MAG: cellulose synthase complex outer membrane protein BcsC [Oceanisphaera sp.]|uniref:cellulose synthase complex outer membrane protein BcsC n=1 Tax=Oceanisphaera sp. TaxID=1929979 RepID=UPI003C752755
MSKLTNVGPVKPKASASTRTLGALGWSLLVCMTSLSLMPLSVAAQTASLTQSTEQLLLEQIRLGEASYRDRLVEESLHRLELIAPNHPQLLAAKIRLALRQENRQQAQLELDKLAKLAPDSEVYRQAKNALLLSSASGRQQLQQARLLAAAGRLPEAQQAYLALFGQDFPTLDLAVEYWRLAARFPEQQQQAINALQTLDKQYPSNANLQTVLVDLLFDNQQLAQGVRLLQLMIADPDTQRQASERWLAQIKSLPISDASLAQLQQLGPLSDKGTKPQVAALLAEQQSLLANPAFRAKQRGLSLVAANKGGAAIAPLQQALRTYPDEVALIGGLAEAYSQTDQRQLAIPFFERAVRLADADNDNLNKWQSLLASQRYWLAIQQGDNALSAQDWPKAERAYQAATRLDGQDAFGWLGLGQVALAQQNLPEAERYFKQAQARDPLNSSALLRVFELKRQQSVAQAEQFLANLSRAQRQALDDNLPRLQSELLQAKATPFEQTQQWATASDLLFAARELTPNEVWLSYRLANDLRQAQQPARADQVFRELAAQRPTDPQQVYAYGLYLSASERETAALAHLASLPKNKWDQDITDLAARLEQDLLLAKARTLREQGETDAARDLLLAQPSNPRLELTLADWALEDNQPETALAQYRQLLKTASLNDADSDAARLGEIEALLALKQTLNARGRLHALPKVPEGEATLNRQRRLANAWSQVGEMAIAEQLFSAQQVKVEQQPKSPEAALWWRDRARLAKQTQQPQQALTYYKQAMQAGGMSEEVGEQASDQPITNNDDFTRLTRIELADDWLKRSIRSDAADLYRQQDTRLTFNQDYQRSSGTGGYSDLTAHVSMLQLDTPLAAPVWLGLADPQGQAFVRADVVQMDAGNFSVGAYQAPFGTCDDAVCNRDQSQTAEGVSLGVGWQNEQWQADIGTTPLGFEVVDWVGSLNYSSDWQGLQSLGLQNIGWELGVSRRPITSSLLSFAGTNDPNSQQVWGGVRVTQLALSGSYDQGEAHGVWGNADLGLLTGKNVEDNQRYRLMGGYYYKLVNEDHKRVSIGTNSMWWQYQKDLSGYTLGQGGYYSPQQYFSLSLPVSYRQRTDDWSWELSGSYSWSRAVTDGQRPYPLVGLLPTNNNYNNDEAAGGSSNGFGYTFKALIERRLGSHWVVGAALDIQQAKDYTPSHGLMYVRYSFGGWQGDLDLPPQPLIPYGDF